MTDREKKDLPMKKIQAIVFQQSLWESVCSDFITFSFLLLCMWYSYSEGGGWWTFFTCSMFLIFLGAKCQRQTKNILRIYSKKEAIEWAESLPEDQDQIEKERK